MILDKMINELELLKKEFGGQIEVQLQDDGHTGVIIDYLSFFIVPEEYEDENDHKETIINLRWWPY